MGEVSVQVTGPRRRPVRRPGPSQIKMYGFCRPFRAMSFCPLLLPTSSQFCFWFWKKKEGRWEKNERERDRGRRIRAANLKSLLRLYRAWTKGVPNHLADQSQTRSLETSTPPDLNPVVSYHQTSGVSSKRVWLTSPRWLGTAWFESNKISKKNMYHSFSAHQSMINGVKKWDVSPKVPLGLLSQVVIQLIELVNS